MEKKCTCCGGSNLKEFNIGNEDIKKYVCLDCLHIEFYAFPDSEALKNLLIKAKKEEEINKKVLSLTEEKEKLLSTLPALKRNVEASERRIADLKKQSENEELKVKEQKAILEKISTACNYYEASKEKLEYTKKRVSKIDAEIKKLSK